MSTLKQRLDRAEAAIRNKAPALDSQLTKEIRRAVAAFSAHLPCPADVSPDIWQVILDLDEEC